jgi:hypothetical protein
MAIHALPGGISLVRTSVATVDGYAENTEAAPVALTGAPVHPATGRDLERLPEGLRAREAIWVYSPVEVACEEAGMQPDILVYQPAGDAAAKRYVAYSCEDWRSQGGHWRVLATRERV